MRTYILKRVLISVPLILTMSFIVFFFITTLSPGDYFKKYEADPKQDRRRIEKEKRELGFYKPVVIRYFSWLRGIFFDVKTTNERNYIADFEEMEIEKAYEPTTNTDVQFAKRNDKGYYSLINFSGNKEEFYQLNQFNNPNKVEKAFWNLWDAKKFDRVEMDIENLGQKPIDITISFLSKNNSGKDAAISYSKNVGLKKEGFVYTLGKYVFLTSFLFAVMYFFGSLILKGLTLKRLFVLLASVCVPLFLYIVVLKISDYDHEFSVKFNELKQRGFNLENVQGIRISSRQKGTILFDNLRLKERRMRRGGEAGGEPRWFVLSIFGAEISAGPPNFGRSFETREPVFKRLWPRMKNTLKLSFFAVLFTWLVALPIGIYCAVHQYSIGDNIFAFLSFVGMSIPNFFFSLLLLYLVSRTWDLDINHILHGLFPIGGLTSDNFSQFAWWKKILDQAWHLILPILMTVSAGLAGLQRQMRGNLLEELRKLYVTTARSKGLPENKVIYKHAVRNAINPMVTYFGYFFTALISSSALVEIIFAYPGVGRLMLDAVLQKDLYVVMGSMMLGGVLLISGNLMADILLAAVDPRIRYE